MDRPENPHAFAAYGESCGQVGMTLRDYFAGQLAPQVLRDLTTGALTPEEDGRTWGEIVAQESYSLSDAMLAERSK